MGKNFNKPEPKKTAKIKQTGELSSSSGSTDNQKPAFCFQHLHGDHNITKLDAEEKRALIEKLIELSNMTWQQLKLSGRHGLGTEKINRNSILVSIPPSITEEVTFLSIRFNGMKPMVGYRGNRIFHIVYLDHNFSVYNHGS